MTLDSLCIHSERERECVINYDDGGGGGAIDDLSNACCINGLNSKAFMASSKLHYRP